MSAAREYHSFAEFWPLYVREHSRAATRRWHFVGTLAALISLAWALVVDLRWLWAVPVVVVTVLVPVTFTVPPSAA